MPTEIRILIGDETHKFLSEKYRIHKSTGGKLTYSQYVGQFIEGMIFELTKSTK